MKNISFLFKTTLIALAMTTSLSSQAGVFSVTPLRVNFKPQEKAMAITINNEGDSELVMQAELYKWTQTPTG